VHILFDEQVFLLQRRGGISRYFVELIRTFILNPDLQIEPVLNFDTTSNEFLLSLSLEFGLGINPSSSRKLTNIARSTKKNVFSFPKVDLVHHTFYSKIFWHSSFKGPRVTTHYDMIPETFHETRLGINPHLSKHWYFKNVNHIFSISQSAKHDLMRIWPDVDTPITVTHLGKRDVSKRNLQRVQGHIIFVGARSGYKDAETLIRAFGQLPQQLRIKLEFLGGDKFTEFEKDLIASLGIEKCTTQRNVTDLELVEAYSKAHLFVFPSHYEGFGLPALEALQLGCRSILANTPALKEIAGKCADYFEPGNVNQLTKLILDSLTDGVEFNPYVESGICRAGNFSWLATAKETASVYQTLI